MAEAENMFRDILLDTIQLKIVYWGPGEAGKTTNYLRLMEKYSCEKISTGFSIDTTSKRTLWQDSGFISFNTKISGKDLLIVIQITTCTGQERFLSSREYVLGGADGIIFVADSDPSKMKENVRSFNELLSFISGLSVPFLIQLNKRDLPDAVSIERFKAELNLPDEITDEDGYLIVYPAVAVQRKSDIFSIFHDLVEKTLTTIFYAFLNNGEGKM
jgi:signal recognition particle receptor subunit beta